VNIRLKPETLPYLNRNLFLHSPDADLWNVRTDRVESVLVHYYPTEGNQPFEQAIDLMTPMRKSDVPEWQSDKPGHRGEVYEAFKREKAAECIRFVSRYLPGLEEAIDSYWTSTPLTYESYTGSRDGSAFGITKDWQSPMTTVLSSSTPIENLLLTGQSLNLHGILGTSMTSLFTSAQLIGKEKIKEEFKI